MKNDQEVKTLQNGGKQELQSCADSGILLVTQLLRDLVFFFSTRAVPRFSAPAVTERSDLLLDLCLVDLCV